MSRSPITTHILDTSLGRPAKGVAVSLERNTGDGWQPIGSGATDGDGRLSDLLEPGSLEAGTFRIRFDTDGYFEQSGRASFYPSVTVEFRITAIDEHYHVPLLLNPFGYSTYRGS